MAGGARAFYEVGRGVFAVFIVIALFLSAGCVGSNERASGSQRQFLAGTSAGILSNPLQVAAWESWDQFGGGPGHEGFAQLPLGTLDVVATGKLSNPAIPTDSAALDFIPSPYGLLSYTESESSSCSFQVFPDLQTGAPSWNETAQCWPDRQAQGFGGPILIAYDDAKGLLFTCNFGGDDRGGPNEGFIDDPTATRVEPGLGQVPLLRAWSPNDGTMRWEVSYDQLISDPNTRLFKQTACRGYAYDPIMGRIYVALVELFYDEFRPIISVVNATTGSVIDIWPLPPMNSDATPTLNGPDSASWFAPMSITLTTTGIVVLGGLEQPTGLVASQETESDEEAGYETAISMNFQGGILRIFQLGDPDTGSRLSGVATSREETAAFAMGDSLFFLNPGVTIEPVRVQMPVSEEEASAFAGVQLWANPVWWQDYVVVPTASAITAYRPNNSQHRWIWQPVDAWLVDSIVLDAPERVFALGHRRVANGSESMLFELRLSDGAEIRRVPLPLELDAGSVVQQKRGTLLPIENVGLLASDWQGNFAVLATSSGVAGAEATPVNAFPAEREHAELRVKLEDERVKGITVAWGDGATQTVRGGGEHVLVHRYLMRERFYGHATFVFDDNTTHSEPFEFRVGESAPPRLNAAQRAFSSENQEITFFIIGLGLTTAGATYAVARRRSHRGRLAIYMEELQAIRRSGRDDPNIGLPGLSHFRRRLRDHWQSGRLDEAGFLAVDSRAQAATRMMTSLFLDEMDSKPGTEFATLLATALDDGELSTRELARLETAMKDDPKIGKADRIRLRDLFDAVVRG